MMSIQWIRNKLVNEYTAAAVGALALTAVTLGDAPEAHAKEPTQVAATTGLPGKPVEITRGKLIGSNEAQTLARYLNNQGCPATVASNPSGHPKRITIVVDGKSQRYPAASEAAAAALDLCKS